MSAPLLAARHTLAEVIGSANPRTQHVYFDGNDACLAIADTLLASGRVRDPATLADDDSIYDSVENAVMVALMRHGHADGCWPDVTAAALAALTAALTKGGAE